MAALDISHNPATVRLAQRATLPAGLTLLLRIAAGDSEAIASATEKTGRTERRLREAAGFFIEQVLLHPDSSSYRVLGGGVETPTAELRRNMALLLSWLHPDVAAHNNIDAAEIDRSVFAGRVTQAWENLKTEERRARYNATMPVRKKSPRRNVSPRGAGVAKPKPRRTSASRIKPIAEHRDREDFITRLARFLLGAPR